MVAAIRRSFRVLLASPLLVLFAACGSDDDSSPGDADTAETAETAETIAADPAESDDAAADEGSDTTATAGDAPASDDDATAPGGGEGGTATLTLENGEVFQFTSLLCSLEPQMAAGSEILFSATSYEDPGLDITQFGDEGTITGIASISVYDGDFATLWSADSSTDVELTLDGSTIRGTGRFFQGEDFAGETVAGEVLANC